MSSNSDESVAAFITGIFIGILMTVIFIVIVTKDPVYKDTDVRYNNGQNICVVQERVFAPQTRLNCDK